MKEVGAATENTVEAPSTLILESVFTLASFKMTRNTDLARNTDLTALWNTQESFRKESATGKERATPTMELNLITLVSGYLTEEKELGSSTIPVA
jgi:hypothetical protein